MTLDQRIESLRRYQLALVAVGAFDEAEVIASRVSRLATERIERDQDTAPRTAPYTQAARTRSRE